jgi:heme-degrading monooxygenase HmoA
MVVLINVIDVEPANVEKFLGVWKRVSGVMERQPGFIRTRLHRALSASRFVNVAEWESQDAFDAAFRCAEFQEAAQAFAGLVTSSPALYQVEYDAKR